MLVSLGLDHRRARLEVRERFYLDDGDLPRIYAELARRGAGETVVTRTCNRIEMYCWWPGATSERARAMAAAWVGADGAEAEALLDAASARHGGDAARHLFRVASGLESQILGDIHILGQLRRAFQDAALVSSVGSHLHRVFETAFRVGKRVKRETRLLAARNGVGSETARRAAARFGDLAGRTCVVVGCGKSGTHTARCLLERGARDLVLVNRTEARAEKLARELGTARTAGIDSLECLLADADLVVVATGAPAPVLTRRALEAARAGRGRAHPLLVIDVSMPRNVEASVADLDGVELVDLDALHPEAAALEKMRIAAVPQAESLVEEGVDELLRWLDLEAARRSLRPLRNLLAEICEREIVHLAGASPLAQRTVERIVSSVLAQPMTALRAASERGESVDAVAGALGHLFTQSESSPNAGDRSPSAG